MNLIKFSTLFILLFLASNSFGQQPNESSKEHIETQETSIILSNSQEESVQANTSHVPLAEKGNSATAKFFGTICPTKCDRKCKKRKKKECKEAKKQCKKERKNCIQKAKNKKKECIKNCNKNYKGKKRRKCKKECRRTFKSEKAQCKVSFSCNKIKCKKKLFCEACVKECESGCPCK